ncbi:MAG TPA: hypothetical protein VHM70_01590, partial [Polyangiaceae bacterium]|nr:hypothetical protein [Polyangiaceae bacterium]
MLRPRSSAPFAWSFLFLLVCDACSRGQTGDAGLETNAIGKTNGHPTKPVLPDDAAAPVAPGPSGGPSRPNVANPSGDCVPADDGGRAGDHAPDPSDKYLPDCQLDLAREYYRVFEKVDGTAYMIPRPDGNPELLEPCADPSNPLHDLTQRYPICESATSSEATNAINRMTPTDALELARFLHDRLVFYVNDAGVVPYPFAADVLAACEANEDLRTNTLKERCAFEVEAAKSGVRDDRAWTHTGVAGAALADALNELYGIEPSGLCNRLSASANREISRAVADVNHCTADDDCASFGATTSCTTQCNALVASDSADDATSALAAIDAAQCAAFTRAGCPVPPIMCSPAQGSPSCVGGVCAYAAAAPSNDLADQLTGHGGCADVLIYAVDDAGTQLVRFYVKVDPFDAAAVADAGLEQTLFELPMAGVELTLLRGQELQNSVCTDVPVGVVEASYPASSGRMKLTRTGQSGQEPHATLVLDDVVFDVPGERVTLDHLE